MSHYITCPNCGEPECMDSDTGVHRRDDGTVCPDPRDAVIEGLRAEVARLRAALDALAKATEFPEHSDGHTGPENCAGCRIEAAVEVARAAIAAKGGAT